MKLRIGLVVLALALGTGVAAAQEHHMKGALGFHEVDAPLGIRWWFSEKMAFDGGLGFGSDEIGGENFSHMALDLGLPITLKSWDRVHFIVRPGIVYRTQEVPTPPAGTDNNTQMVIQGELEAEVFLVENFSVSAAHGFAIVNNDPAVGGSTTDYGTTGANFTNIGFHVYLFGGQ
jgi:hypothetical protein